MLKSFKHFLYFSVSLIHFNSDSGMCFRNEKKIENNQYILQLYQLQFRQQNDSLNKLTVQVTGSNHIMAQ